MTSKVIDIEFDDKRQLCNKCSMRIPGTNNPYSIIDKCFNCYYENQFQKCLNCNKKVHFEYFNDAFLSEYSTKLDFRIKNLWLGVMKSKEYCNECSLEIAVAVKNRDNNKISL